MAKLKVIITEYPAVGGPKSKSLAADGYTAGPTDSGRYVLAYCGKHSSRAYPQWSKIPWGSDLKEEKGHLYVVFKKKWTLLSNVTSVTKKDIVEYHELLYGTPTAPKTWVFNDFGHMTCYFYEDKNKNKKFEPSRGEKIHSEFFHTTPVDEAATELKSPISLTESHGCVHLRPLDIDEMIKKGYMKRGNKVVVHMYTDKVPAYPKKPAGKSPYELHFYPGIRKLVIIGYSPH